MTNKPIISLWKTSAKNGNKYFTGKDSEGERVIAFYVSSKKKNRPAIKIYNKSVLDNTPKQENAKELCALWLKKSKAGKNYLSGKIGNTYVLGFINDKAKEKQPYINIYEQEKTADTPVQTTLPDSEDLPF